MANMNNSIHASFPVSIDYYARAIEKYSTTVILTPRTIGENNQTKVGVTYEGVNPPCNPIMRNQPIVNRIENDIASGHDINEDYDGKIRSVPYIKNGPYTCQKCQKQFVTSQRFAAHAFADHYKNESNDQRRKRTLSKVQRRIFSLRKVSGGLTVVPIPSVGAGTSKVFKEDGKRISHQSGKDLTMKVRVEGVIHDVPAHGMEALGDGLAGAKIKLEPSA